MDDLFGSSAPESDPQADFLARERAALGDDLSSFSSSSQQPQSQDKDYETSASAFPDLGGDDDEDALAGFTGGAPVGNPGSGMGQQVSVTGDNEFAAFEQDYPEVEIPSQQPHSNGFDQQSYSNGNEAPMSNYANPYSQPTSFVQPPQPNDEESEFIQTWRAKQAQEIAEREEKAQGKKEETIAKARNAIDNFYKDYNSKKEKSIAQNKEDEEKFKSTQSDSLAQGTTWERICTLVDLTDSRSKTSTKSKQDLSRFKEVLLSLKREGENAPGAGGY